MCFLCGRLCDHDRGGRHKSELLEGHLEVLCAEHLSRESRHHAESYDAGLVALLELDEQADGGELLVLLECLGQGCSVGQADLDSCLFVVFWRRRHSGHHWSWSDWSHWKRSVACLGTTSGLVRLD